MSTRSEAIIELCDSLSNHYHVDLSKLSALDFFAREGDWQTKHYASRVKNVVAWEINPLFEKSLKSNLPESAEVLIGDSFQLSKLEKRKFDLVVIDNPQGCFGEKNRYCEHFEAVEEALALVKRDGILVFNVKLTPFNYSSNVEWQDRRNKFYGLEDSSSLSKEFIDKFYRAFFSRRGFNTKFTLLVKRPQEPGLYELAVKFE